LHGLQPKLRLWDQRAQLKIVNKTELSKAENKIELEKALIEKYKNEVANP
jgi:hypothetical protein